MLRDGGVGFYFAAVGGGGGGSQSLSRGCWDFWWVMVAGLTGLWGFFFLWLLLLDFSQMHGFNCC